MDFILYSSALLVVSALLFFAIERPYAVATFLVFCFVYRFNVNLPGPLDSRGLLTLFLLARLFLFDKHNYLLVRKYLFRNFTFVLLVIFILISFYTTYSYYGELKNLVKLFFLIVVSIILGFIIIINGQGQKVFLKGIVLAGIFSTIDLIWSTIKYGTLNIRSLLKTLVLHESLHEYDAYNHGFFALICCFAIIMLYISHIKKQIPVIISAPLILFLSLGVIISTSRSTIIAMIFVFIIIFLVQKEIQFNLKKIMSMILSLALFFISFYFIYNALLSSGDFNTSFIDETYYRLYEEPMSVFGGNKKKVFNERGKAKEGTSEWRYNRSMKDLAKYSRLDLKTQLFGIGVGGYTEQNFGEDFLIGYALGAHNGYVLILVERGIVGLLLYIYIILYLSFKSLKLLRQGLIDVPIVYVFLALAFFCIGNNGELTDQLAFFLLGAMFANIKESLVSNYGIEENQNLSSNSQMDNHLVHDESPVIIKR